MVSDGAGNDSIDVVVVVPSVESGVVVVGVGVGVIGLQGAALPSMALVLSVSGTGFAFSREVVRLLGTGVVYLSWTVSSVQVA